MAYPIDNLRGVNYANAAQRTGHGVAASAETNRAIQYKNGAAFTTTGAYREFQSRVMQLLGENGFTAQQAQQLSDVAQLSIEQVVRSLVIAKQLQTRRDIFDSYTRVLKMIVALNRNSQQGLDNFLAGLERLLGTNTKQLLQQLRESYQRTPPRQSSDQSETASKSGGQEQGKVPTQETRQGMSDFEVALYKDIGKQVAQKAQAGVTSQMDHQLEEAVKIFKRVQPHIKQQMTASQSQIVSDFHLLAETSLEEFPKRYHVDLLAFSEFSRYNVTLDTYLKLASEVSPLRLLNLLVIAKQKGHDVQSVINSLVSMQNSGGSLKDAMNQLEHQFGMTAPKEGQTATKVASIMAKEITMEQGEELDLQFMAFDTTKGIVPEAKSGFVVFPQGHEYTGNALQLAYLPVGAYMIMAKAMDDNNVMMNMWIKVIVRDRERRKQREQSEKFNKEFKKQGQQQEDQQDDAEEKNQTKRDEVHGVMMEGPEHLETERAPVSSSDAPAIFEEQPSNYRGPFLGEVTLPFDYLKRSAEDLLIVSNESGIIIDPEEFYSGSFEHNAVTFRFLANHLEPMDRVKRHQLLNFKKTPQFEQFNDSLVRFVRRPKFELEQWKNTIDDFFKYLQELFPAGKDTFHLAQRFFSDESEKFANGEQSREQFQNVSFEQVRDQFVAGIYEKGGYALAAAGDVAAALKSMSFASLVDLSDQNRTANLGEYLSEIKQQYDRGDGAPVANKRYAMHLNHNIAHQLLANPYYKDQGRKLLDVSNLGLDDFDDDSSRNKGDTGPTHGYGAYQKYQTP